MIAKHSSTPDMPDSENRSTIRILDEKYLRQRVGSSIENHPVLRFVRVSHGVIPRVLARGGSVCGSRCIRAAGIVAEYDCETGDPKDDSDDDRCECFH